MRVRILLLLLLAAGCGTTIPVGKPLKATTSIPLLEFPHGGYSSADTARRMHAAIHKGEVFRVMKDYREYNPDDEKGVATGRLWVLLESLERPDIRGWTREYRLEFEELEYPERP